MFAIGMVGLGVFLGLVSGYCLGLTVCEPQITKLEADSEHRYKWAMAQQFRSDTRGEEIEELRELFSRAVAGIDGARVSLLNDNEHSPLVLAALRKLDDTLDELEHLAKETKK